MHAKSTKGEIAFLSQTTPTYGAARGGKRGQPKAHKFYLATPGCTTPLKLEYTTKEEAQKAKSALLQTPNVHLIQGMKTFEAVVEAMARLAKLSMVTHNQQEPAEDNVDMTL